MATNGPDTSSSDEITAKLGVGLTPAEKRQVRLAAARAGCSMSELVRQLIRAWLAEGAEVDNLPTSEPSSPPVAGGSGQDSSDDQA